MRLTRGGLQYRPFHHTEALNIQIKRLLNDREVFAGDKVFDARERFYAYVEHAGGKLTDFDGNEVLYGKPDFKNPSLILKNKNVL